MAIPLVESSYCYRETLERQINYLQMKPIGNLSFSMMNQEYQLPNENFSFQNLSFRGIFDARLNGGIN